jgi:hypothetical protein
MCSEDEQLSPFKGNFDPCCVTGKVKRIKWAQHVLSMGEKSNAYRVLVRKLEGKRPLEEPRRM